MIFKNRKEAGRLLAKKLKLLIGNPDNTVVYHHTKNGFGVVVYALPRGGVVLGYEIAKILKCPLSLIITRKIGHPVSPEYAVGVVTEDGETLLNEAEVPYLDKKWLEKEIEKEKKEAKRRREVYLDGLPAVQGTAQASKKPISAKGKIAIIVDDGVATGLSLFLAIKAIKKEKPEKIIVAIPVAPLNTAEQIKKEVDELEALIIDPNYLGAVGAYYENFEQVEDRGVIEILRKLDKNM